MKSNRLFCFLTIAIMIFTAFLVFPVVSATDQDEDGLDDDWESENDYDNTTKDHWETSDVKAYQEDYIATFLFVTIVSFGIFSFVLGAFTTRYAQGRSRITGAILLTLGSLIGIVTFVFGIFDVVKYPDDTLAGIIHWQVQLIVMPALTILGAGIGAFLAMVLFLVIIMKA
jgi:MFS family permease